jgi:hypothetical protein
MAATGLKRIASWLSSPAISTFPTTTIGISASTVSGGGPRVRH